MVELETEPVEERCGRLVGPPMRKVAVEEEGPLRRQPDPESQMVDMLSAGGR
jgi:hypothetical protein